MKKTMQRRRPWRLGKARLKSHADKAKMIREGANMGEHSWLWIHQAEWRADMQRTMRKVQ